MRRAAQALKATGIGLCPTVMLYNGTLNPGGEMSRAAHVLIVALAVLVYCVGRELDFAADEHEIAAMFPEHERVG